MITVTRRLIAARSLMVLLRTMHQGVRPAASRELACRPRISTVYWLHLNQGALRDVAVRSLKDNRTLNSCHSSSCWTQVLSREAFCKMFSTEVAKINENDLINFYARLRKRFDWLLKCVPHAARWLAFGRVDSSAFSPIVVVWGDQKTARFRSNVLTNIWKITKRFFSFVKE